MQLSKLISLSLVATLSLTTFLSSPSEAAPIVCNKACTFIYQPVCAQLQSGKTQTFGNACTLETYNCEHPHSKAKVLAQSACEEMYPTCDIMCAMIHQPICATSTKDGKTTKQTFSNSCLLRVHNCQNPDDLFNVFSESACEVEAETEAAVVVPVPEKRSTPLLPTCDIACTLEYAPVCTASKNGKHFQTFSNECALSVFNCQNPDNAFTVVSQNACEDEATEATTPKKRSTPLLPTCDIACTMEYAPVCTVDIKNGNHYQTFSNKCMLSVFNCQNPDNTFRPVAQDLCPIEAIDDTSSPAAPAVEALADNSDTGAIDDLVLEDLSVEEGSDIKCGSMCMMVIDPVCAKDKRGQLRRFNNRCLLNQYTCKHPAAGLEYVEDKSCFLL
ncbi:hypothetical protein BGZ96_005718 [Linnemannia gamsii]|uniref:Kazal-like domain-containing protein n=1 Tax=Linnemannia gamsii TaxID=64522 RepID=A0ABQ7K3M8_9FUNG|nr:hypothetical protein BGZ96_005718 [Linnemannia gamsii]